MKCYVMADIVQNAVHQYISIISARAHIDGTVAQPPWGLEASYTWLISPNIMILPAATDDTAAHLYLCRVGVTMDGEIQETQYLQCYIMADIMQEP